MKKIMLIVGLCSTLAVMSCKNNEPTQTKEQLVIKTTPVQPLVMVSEMCTNDWNNGTRRTVYVKDSQGNLFKAKGRAYKELLNMVYEPNDTVPMPVVAECRNSADGLEYVGKKR